MLLLYIILGRFEIYMKNYVYLKGYFIIYNLKLIKIIWVIFSFFLCLSNELIIVLIKIFKINLEFKKDLFENFKVMVNLYMMG